MEKTVKIIYDTDIGGDCDDAGTLAMLHRLCDKGEAELLAVTHCCSSPYVAGCIDAINTYFNRRVPIGINYEKPLNGGGTYAQILCEGFPNEYLSNEYPNREKFPDTLTVLRQVLANAEDKSVTLVATGTLCSMARLIASEPDDISPLSGKQLVAQKINRTVVMGGRFFESWPMPIFPDGNTTGNPVTWEWNIRNSGLSAAQTVCEEWTGELIFSSYEIGSYIKTMVDYPRRVGLQSPVAMAYEVHNHGAGRCSWDQTAMLDAVRPNTYWHYHEYGKITVDKELITRWQSDKNGKHTYLLPKTDYEEVRRVIDDLIDGK